MQTFKAIELLHHAQISFVSYRLPQSQEVKLLYGGAFVELLPQGASNYFLVAPFVVQADWPMVYYVSGREYAGEDVILEHHTPDLKVLFIPNAEKPLVSSKSDYLKQAQHIIHVLKTGEMKKVVLSRIIEKPLPKADQTLVYQALCDKYPDAFVYFLQFANGVSWIGATPETLLTAKENRATTVALAATRRDKNTPLSEVVWGEKEQSEQGMVSDFIENILQQTNDVSYIREATATVKAGPLLHLKTRFEISTHGQFSWLPLVKQLHPTPAVCGLPRQAALEKLLSIEPHQRLLYTGFLGPVDQNSELQLFVNLRCMMLLADDAFLFVGGGFTALSDAEAEWEETESKAETLLSVFPNNSPTLQHDAR